MALQQGSVAGGDPDDREPRNGQQAVVKWEDPQRAPPVEDLEVGLAVLGIDEDSRDEKSAQDEEKIHAQIAALEETVNRGVRFQIFPDHDEMAEHHHQDRQSPEAVQAGNVALHRHGRRDCLAGFGGTHDVFRSLAVPGVNPIFLSNFGRMTSSQACAVGCRPSAA